MYRILYRFLASLARLAVRSGRSKDLEIIVLRHQLGVLRRQVDRPAFSDDERSLLGAIAAALPRPRRHGWLVSPDTLLRWHRRRIARHWTQPVGAGNCVVGERQIVPPAGQFNPAGNRRCQRPSSVRMGYIFGQGVGFGLVGALRGGVSPLGQGLADGTRVP